MLTIRPLQQRAIAGVLASDLAENAIWQPAAGGSAAVRVLVERMQRLVDDALTTAEDEEIKVTVWRDPETATFDDGSGTIDLGGVLAPRVGDRLVRDASRDSDRPYTFGGEVLAETPYTWRLVLRRKRMQQAGVTALATR